MWINKKISEKKEKFCGIRDLNSISLESLFFEKEKKYNQKLF